MVKSISFIHKTSSRTIFKRKKQSKTREELKSWLKTSMTSWPEPLRNTQVGVHLPVRWRREVQHSRHGLMLSCCNMICPWECEVPVNSFSLCVNMCWNFKLKPCIPCIFLLSPTAGYNKKDHKEAIWYWKQILSVLTSINLRKLLFKYKQEPKQTEKFSQFPFFNGHNCGHFYLFRTFVVGCF